MSSFSRYHFQGQHENEEVLRIIHRHWFNISVHYAASVLVTLVILSSFIAIPAIFPDLLSVVHPSLFYFVFNTFVLFMWIYAFLVWIDYYFDVWIITNERIVNIEQKGLFARQVSELKFSRVQDVTSVVDGFFPTILNFGDVYVQTAAEQERFAFRQIPDPYAIKDMVMKLSQSSTDEDLRRLSETLRIGKRIA